MNASQQTSALVDPAWLAAHQGDPNVCLIEVSGLRDEEEEAYKAGHIRDAYAWKWLERLWDARVRDFPPPQEFARRLGAAGIGNDTTVVFYGEGVAFGIYAWWVFRYCGHTNVRVLDGARARWVEEGRPLVTEERPPRPATNYTPIERVEHMRITKEAVLEALRKTNTVLLDARSPEEYRGERVGVAPGADVGAIRYGRIPGAQHLFYMNLLKSNNSFRPLEELRRIAVEHSVGPGKNTVAYCRLGHRASVVYFALTQLLGYNNVRVYDGSWVEWGNMVGVPVER